MLDEIEERRLAPVRVVEQNDERLLRGVRLEQLAEGPGDLLRRARRRAVAQDRRQRAGHAVLGCQLLDDLGHRPVADPLAVGETAPSHDLGAVESGQELLDEPGLPDAGRTEDREQMARALTDDVRERALEDPSLALAADHLGAVAACGRLRLHGYEAIGRQRLRLPLRL